MDAIASSIVAGGGPSYTEKTWLIGAMVRRGHDPSFRFEGPARDRAFQRGRRRGRAAKALVDHQAQATNAGWKNSPTSRRSVGVQAETIVAVDELADVSREHGDEEQAGGEAEQGAAAAYDDRRRTERDLDDAGQDHHEVLVDAHPVGHLRLKVDTGERQMPEPGEDASAAPRTTRATEQTRAERVMVIVRTVRTSIADEGPHEVMRRETLVAKRGVEPPSCP